MQHDLIKRDRVVEPYDASVLGAPFKVLLLDGFVREVSPETGKITMEIEDLPGLIAAVVRSRVLHPRKMSGGDLKFIRSVLCIKSNKIAEGLALSPEHYSRCEGGTKTMSVATEKLYRMFVYLTVSRRDRVLNKTVTECQKLKDVTGEEAQRAIEAFQNIFHDMRIDIMCPATEELSFTFCRRCSADPVPCGNDDGEWRDRPPIAA